MEFAQFKALPFNRDKFAYPRGRLSVPPPKLTKAVGFHLATELRGSLLPSKQAFTEEPFEGFRARKMPSFPKPSSPARSNKSTEFRGK